MKTAIGDSNNDVNDSCGYIYFVALGAVSKLFSKEPHSMWAPSVRLGLTQKAHAVSANDVKLV